MKCVAHMHPEYKKKLDKLSHKQQVIYRLIELKPKAMGKFLAQQYSEKRKAKKSKSTSSKPN